MAEQNGAQRRHAWVKWYPTDWRGDAALRLCSYAARGLWADMLSLMMESDRFGYLLIKSRVPTAQQLANLLGGAERDVLRLVEELHEARVFNRVGDQDIPDDIRPLIDVELPADLIFSRRMLRDKAKEEKDRSNGRRGGNPELKPPLEPEGKPPPTTRGLTPQPTPQPNQKLTGGDKAQSPESRVQNPDRSLRERGARAGADDLKPPEFLQRRGGRSIAGPIPTGWQPSDDDRAWLAGAKPDLTDADAARETEAWRLWCREKAAETHDPSASWRRWMMRGRHEGAGTEDDAEAKRLAEHHRVIAETIGRNA